MATARLRMNPAALNSLLTALRDEYSTVISKAEESKVSVPLKKISTGHVELKDTGHSGNMRVDFFAVEQRELPGKKYVVFNVTKDSRNPDVELNLGYIRDAILAFRQQFPEMKEHILLMPVRQSRNFFKLKALGSLSQREHIILAEVMPNGDIFAHDSQKKAATYPNRLPDIAKELGGTAFYDATGKQKSDYECGYFVYRFIEAILLSGDSRECQKIALAHKDVELIAEKITALREAESKKMEASIGRTISY